MQADIAMTSGRDFYALLGVVLRWSALLVALVVLAACDPGSMVEPPPSASCSAIGQRCQRTDGPIGVCQVRPCPPGANEPCYVCTPQH